jgi:hypothetical protein
MEKYIVILYCDTRKITHNMSKIEQRFDDYTILPIYYKKKGTQISQIWKLLFTEMYYKMILLKAFLNEESTGG